MIRGPRGGPGEFEVRLARAERLLVHATGVARQPLALMVEVLRHQEARAAIDSVAATAARAVAGGDRYPLIDLACLGPNVEAELAVAVDELAPHVPGPLADAGVFLVANAATERFEVVGTWLDDSSLVDPRLGWWLRVAAGPLFELAAKGLTSRPGDDWHGAACPACGGPPQASVIAEETGEFMGGSPRSLVCGRCATWWSYPRITCASCGEEDPRRVESFLADGHRWARVDACATCQAYIKTFDLRVPEGAAVIPLVDDVATLTLDVWARDRGYARAYVSLAGV